MVGICSSKRVIFWESYMSDQNPFKFNLSGRVALVTGSSSGLGAGFANALAQAGARVVLAARRADRLGEQVEKIHRGGGQALAVQMDVTNEASIRAAYDSAEQNFGMVDTIVLNAGVAIEKSALDLDLASLNLLLQTNILGVFLAATEGARRMEIAGPSVINRGRIVIIGSITAERVMPYTTVYGATKAAVRQMGRALAREWATRGISVNVIQPGYFSTEMTADGLTGEAGDRFVRSFPRRRLRPQTDLHAPLLLLCSDLAQGITGSVINVDDGQSL